MPGTGNRRVQFQVDRDAAPSADMRYCRDMLLAPYAIYACLKLNSSTTVYDMVNGFLCVV